MRTGDTWDVKLIRTGNSEGGNPVRGIHLPSAISRALAQKGYNRATVQLTEEGILLKPYESTDANVPKHHEAVDLPF